MKTQIRILTFAMAALLPLAANAADDCCSDAEHDCSAETANTDTKAGCCSANAAPIVTAFASPPPVPLATDAKLSEADAAYLASYEKIRAALAGDNLDAAKAAATDVKGAEEIAAAKKIADARVAFKALSATAISKAKGHEGFWIAHCPMVKGGGADWLTTNKKIENPYFGSAMFSCGHIKE
jgi:Cu(I)/Ag(I) efflux system membrane fusion protein